MGHMKDIAFADTVPMHLEFLQDQRQSDDRRSGQDRRRADVGPPGKHERRITLEARKPDVAEVSMSDSQWLTLSRALPPAKN